MAKSYYKIQNKTAISVDIMIYGVIGDSWWDESITAKRFVSDFKELEKQYQRINVHINSPGGSVFDGLPIFNAIHSSSVEVHTYNDGLAASMGAVILLAGKTVHSAKNALTMLHAPLSYVYGTVRDMENTITVLNKVKNSLIECIASKSKKDKADIENKYFDYDDHWLSADDAFEEGFVDIIDEKEVQIPKNIKSMNYADIISEFEKMMNEEKHSRRQNWFSSFFNFKIDNSIDMNLSEILDILGLDAKTSEEDAIEHIRNLVSISKTANDAHTKELQAHQETKNALNAEQTAHQETKNALEETKTKLNAAEEKIKNIENSPGAESDDIPPKSQENSVDFLSEEDCNIFNSL